MLETRKSLASYFDDPTPSTASWHEQTELEAAPQLEAYFKPPGAEDNKKLWTFYPDGTQPSQTPPEGMKLHYYGKKFKDDEWGYDPAKAEKQAARKREMADARAVHSKNVKDNHAEAMKIFVANRGWAGEGSVDIVGTAQAIDGLLAFYKADTKKYRDGVKADPQYATDETGSPENMARIRAKNELIYNYGYNMTDKELEKFTGPVAIYCTTAPAFIDFVTSYKPMHMVEDEVQKPGTYYSTVICGYLYALKSKIMAATFHKVRAHPEWPGAADFVKHSQLANQELSKILKKSKHHKAPKWRADSTGLNSLHAALGKIALREFQTLHPNGTIPNRLKRFQQGYKPEQNRGKKGRNNAPPGQATFWPQPGNNGPPGQWQYVPQPVYHPQQPLHHKGRRMPHAEPQHAPWFLPGHSVPQYPPKAQEPMPGQPPNPFYPRER